MFTAWRTKLDWKYCSRQYCGQWVIQLAVVHPNAPTTNLANSCAELFLSLLVYTLSLLGVKYLHSLVLSHIKILSLDIKTQNNTVAIFSCFLFSSLRTHALSLSLSLCHSQRTACFCTVCSRAKRLAVFSFLPVFLWA